MAPCLRGRSSFSVDDEAWGKRGGENEREGETDVSGIRAPLPVRATSARPVGDARDVRPTRSDMLCTCANFKGICFNPVDEYSRK